MHRITIRFAESGVLTLEDHSRRPGDRYRYPNDEMDARPRIIAEITFLPVSEGGRRSIPVMEIEAKYRPHLVVQDRSVRTAIIDDDRVIQESYLGVEFCRVSKEAGDRLTNDYELELMYHPRVDYTALVTGATFTVREGGRIVAHGKVLKREDIV